MLPALKNKEASFCRLNIATFQHNIAYMVNSFVFSLDIPVMINILYKMIKILHKKILNAIYCIDFIMIYQRYIEMKTIQ